MRASESTPLIKGDRGDVVGEDEQERRGALLAQLADEPGDEKRRIAFAAVIGAHTDRADLDASIEPHAVTGHGGEPAIHSNADIPAKLGGPKGRGFVLLCETHHLGNVARTQHDRRLDP